MISVVLPAYNEEGAVAGTVEEVRRTLDAAGVGDYEVIVVDDGSTDATRQRAEDAGARVLVHPHNVGYGRALKSGIAAARHDVVVISDADGTYPIDRIPELASLLEEGFDMAVGARRHYRESILKAPLRKLLKWLVEYTAGCRIADVNSGLRAFRRSTVTPYLPTLCDTFSFTTSLTLGYLMSNRFVAYLPVSYADRKGSTKVRLLRDSLRTLQYIVQAILYYNPLKIFLLLAFLCIACSAVAFLASATLGLLSGFLLGVGGLLMAVLVFCLGLLADLLKQILDRGGPQGAP